MSDPNKIISVLQEHLQSPEHSFSTGSFGAIAEFHRHSNDSVLINQIEQLTLQTNLGGIRLTIPEKTQAIAYETVSANPKRWHQGVAFCLPEKLALQNQRKVLTELGPDHVAIRTEDQQDILFDMGIGAINIDFCIRTRDQQLITLLRTATGKAFLQLSSAVREAIIQASPTRVVISRLGRIEVYQQIGIDKTPEGPHTHLLPKLIKQNRTHAANIPIPKSLIPCVKLHPANPLTNQQGQAITFDSARFKRFDQLLRDWGIPEYIEEKQNWSSAVLANQTDSNAIQARTKLGRTAMRIALRQSRYQK